MGVDEAMIVAGIGSRKGVSADEVFAAIEAALAQNGLALNLLSVLATTDFKRSETGIFRAAQRLGLRLIVVETAEAARPSSPAGTGGEVGSEANRRGGFRAQHPPSPSRAEAALDTSPPVPEGEDGRQVLTRSAASQRIAGTLSVSELAALAAAGPGARLLGPRIAVGRVTCAIAVGEARP
jgi:cobalt-precorrin 5A hydrolase